MVTVSSMRSWLRRSQDLGLSGVRMLELRLALLTVGQQY